MPIAALFARRGITLASSAAGSSPAIPEVCPSFPRTGNALIYYPATRIPIPTADGRRWDGGVEHGSIRQHLSATERQAV